MKIPFNDSIKQTQEQRKGIVGITVFIGLIIAIAAQTYIVSFEKNISNSGLIEIYENASMLGVILVVLLYCFVVERRRPETLGFHKQDSGKNYILGFALAFIFITVVFLSNLMTNSITVSFDLSAIKWWYVILSLFGFFFQGLMEETVCRGFIMNSIASKFGVLSGILINSIIFALLHSFNGGFNAFGGFNLFIVGILFSVMFYYTNSIFFVGAFHASWNFFVGPIYGVKISGSEIYSPVIKTVGKENHQLINGGNFGFEGSLIVTILTLLLIALFVYLIRTKNWEDIIHGSIIN